MNACRIYSGAIGDVGVVGGTKVTNSCVKTAPGAAEVSLDPSLHVKLSNKDSTRGLHCPPIASWRSVELHSTRAYPMQAEKVASNQAKITTSSDCSKLS